MKLKNISGEVLFLGRPDGLRIDDGEVIEVDGKLAKNQPDDAFVVGEGDDARAYPKATWVVVKSTASKES